MLKSLFYCKKCGLRQSLQHKFLKYNYELLTNNNLVLLEWLKATISNLFNNLSFALVNSLPHVISIISLYPLTFTLFVSVQSSEKVIKQSLIFKLG